jgi:hypothetical protein
MANESQQYDLTTATQDPDFLKASMADKMAFLSAHDSDFANASQQDKTAYLNHILGNDQQASQPSFSQRLTAGYNPGVEDFAQKHPILGPPARFLDAAGGAALGFLPSLYHAVADPLTSQEESEFQGHTRIPGEVAIERLTSAPLVRAAQTYADPQTRPTLSQAASVLPEVLGQGVGTTAAGYGTAEAAKPALPWIKSGAGVVRDAAGELVHDPAGALRPGAKFAAQVGGGAVGAGAGLLSHTPYGPIGGAALGAHLGPSLLDEIAPQHPYVRTLNEFGIDPNDVSSPLSESPNLDAASKISAVRKSTAKAAAADVPTGQSQRLSASPNRPQAAAPPDPFQGMPTTSPADISKLPFLRGTVKASPSATTSTGPSVQMEIPGAPKAKSLIADPNSAPPNVRVTYQSVPQPDLLRMVKGGDTAAITEWQRRGLELPANVGFMTESGAGNLPWRRYKR